MLGKKVQLPYNGGQVIIETGITKLLKCILLNYIFK